MNKSAKIWSKYAKGYSKKPIANEEAYQQKLKITQKYLKPDMKILEIGCGTGGTALIHAPHVKHVRAVDFSSTMIEIARDRATEQNIENVTFECVAGEELNVVDQSLDVVLGLSLLHLVEDKEELIAKIHAMLKSDGVFVSNTGCLGDKMAFFKFMAPIGHFLGFMPLIKVFKAKELEDSLINAGFEIDYCWQPDKISLFVVAKKPA